MTKEVLPILIRGPMASDVPCIKDNWRKNAANRSWHYRGIDGLTFKRAHDRILQHTVPRTTVLVACDPGAIDIIYGWICSEVIDNELVIHYLYVKSAFKRGHRVGTKLVQEVLRHEALPTRRIVITHETKAVKAFVAALHANGTLPSDVSVVYDPFLLYSSLPHGWYA